MNLQNESICIDFALNFARKSSSPYSFEQNLKHAGLYKVQCLYKGVIISTEGRCISGSGSKAALGPVPSASTD